MLSNLFDKTAAKKTFVQDMNYVRSNHKPEKKDQRDVHIIARFLNRSEAL